MIKRPNVQAIIADMPTADAEQVFGVILDALKAHYGHVEGIIQDRFEDAIDVSIDLPQLERHDT